MGITSIDPSLLVHNTAITGANTGWNAGNVLMPRIEKVANGYTVSIDYELYIAENVEAVTGIISAQLLKLGAK